MLLQEVCHELVESLQNDLPVRPQHYRMHTTDPCTLLPPVDPLFTLCTRGVFVMCVSMSVLYPRRCPRPTLFPTAARLTRDTQDGWGGRAI